MTDPHNRARSPLLLQHTSAQTNLAHPHRRLLLHRHIRVHTLVLGMVAVAAEGIYTSQRDSTIPATSLDGSSARDLMPGRDGR